MTDRKSPKSKLTTPDDDYGYVTDMHGRPKLFDITCVIGSVYVDNETGAPDPRTAAFMLIAQHGAPGEFTFPREDGIMETVTVDWAEPQPAQREDY